MKPKNLIQSIFIKTIILTLILLLTGQATALQAAGEDDDLLVPGFGVGFGPTGSGSVDLDFNATFTAIEVQSDGKIIIVGVQEENFWLARYHTDGALDSSFGVNGQVSTNLSGNDFANAVTIQSNGKIVVAGRSNDDFAVARYHPNGILDDGFGSNGKVVLDFDGGEDSAITVAIQPDGKIVLGGRTEDCGLLGCREGNVGLARFNPDGTVDTTFDGDGKVAFDAGSNGEFIGTLVIELDGRIVAIGASQQRDGDRNIVLARFLPDDGRFDNTLDGDGKITTNIERHSNNGVVQPDGKIIATTLRENGGTHQMGLVRFQANGAVDSSFGSNGIALAPPSPITREIFRGRLLQLPTGKLLFVGDTHFLGGLIVAIFSRDGRLDATFGNGQGYVTHFLPDKVSVVDAAVDNSGGIILLHRVNNEKFLTRLHANGQLDNGQGRVITNPTEFDDQFHDVLVQPDGKVVVAGQLGAFQNNRPGAMMTVARYTRDGRLDTTFNGDGQIIALTDLSVATATALDSQERILVAGQISNAASAFDFTLHRYTTTGAPAHFPAAPDGQWPVTDFNGLNDLAVDMVIQPDGKIVLAGNTKPTRVTQDFALVRYLDNGALDPDFGNGGKITTDINGQNSIDSLQAVALQPDGKIVALGATRADRNADTSSVLVRYLPNGQPDPNFGGGDGIAPAEAFATLALQPDGKIVVGGTTEIEGRRQFAAARYTADGQPDPTFNGVGMAVADFGLEALALDLLLEPDGAIVLAGCVQDSIDPFALARFRADGQLDDTFSGDGKATIDVNSVRKACARAITRDPASGDYLLAGRSEAQIADNQLALIRVQGRQVRNSRPTAGPNSYATTIEASLTVAAPGVLDNDNDPEGQPLLALPDSQPANGQLILIGDGGFIYTPNPGFSGSDSFTYRASDSFNLSDPAIVTIQVSRDPTPNPTPSEEFTVFLPLVVK